MAITDVDKYKSALVGANSNLSAAAIIGLFKRTFSESFANGTAATAVTESVLEHVRRDALVRSITVVAPIAVAADGTNNAVITVSKRTGAGAPVVIATVTTSGANSFVAFVPFSLTLVADATTIAAGDVLTYAVAKGGTGVALSAATSAFKISVDVEET